jgi:hypothetical protein
MAFAFVTSAWDLRSLMNQWYHVGNGGKDVTDELLLLRKAVIKHWKTLSTDEKNDSNVTITFAWIKFD